MNIFLRFRKWVQKLRPTISTTEIRNWWNSYDYTSTFSGQKRNQKIKWQPEQTHNVKLKTFMIDLMQLPNGK